jgi:hypothetical protein
LQQLLQFPAEHFSQAEQDFLQHAVLHVGQPRVSTAAKDACRQKPLRIAATDASRERDRKWVFMDNILRGCFDCGFALEETGGLNEVPVLGSNSPRTEKSPHFLEKLYRVGARLRSNAGAQEQGSNWCGVLEACAVGPMKQ